MDEKLEARITELAKTFPGISGWCPLETFWIWVTLLSFQARSPDPGSLGEIGVFKGKSAAILAALLRPEIGERLALVDIALHRDDISHALSLAGLKAGPETDMVEANSRGATPETLGLEPRTFRWIHIDGEHTGYAVESDLGLSHRLLNEIGIAVVDDFFAPEYPQVTFSTLRYLERHPEHFTPFLVGYRKLYLARPSSARWFKQAVVTILQPEMERHGFKTTLCKTTTTEDLDCFGIVERHEDEVLRGTLDDYERIWTAKGFTAQQLKDMQKGA